MSSKKQKVVPKNVPETKITKKLDIYISSTQKKSKVIKTIHIDKWCQIKKKLDSSDLNINPPHSLNFEYTDEFADFEGKWSWHVHRNWKSHPSHNEYIQKFVTELKSKTWKDIHDERFNSNGSRRAKHVYYEIKKICGEAKQRLRDLDQFDDFEDIFRFRLNNKFRLFGFPSGNVFIAIWHDPEHKIYPIND